MEKEPDSLNIDSFRAYLDERRIGKFAVTHPLQSSLFCSLYIDDDWTTASTECDIMGMLDGASGGCERNRKIPELGSAQHIVSTVMSSLKECIKGEQYSMLDGVELAEDILIATSSSSGSISKSATVLDLDAVNNTKNIIPVPVTIPKPAPKPNVRAFSTQTDSSLSEELMPPSKKGSFQSGRDKFLQDGGKFPAKAVLGQSKGASSSGSKQTDPKNDNPLPPELEHCDKALVEKIEAEIVHTGQVVTFEEIAGLEFAKKCVNELICWPMTRPDLFQGLRSLPRGLLLFGPPGTGKTLIGKAIAHQAGATFFSISASSLTSKWIGEGEKTVRTLFAVAAYRQPSVVFIDEVDSLLCQRSSDENEASRRIKTEFLVQLDGAGTDLSARVVIVGATNRPEELDEAARRRFVKRIYIPLPDIAGRKQLLMTLMKSSLHSLKRDDLEILIARTEGFSGADVRSLCTEAAMGPVREIAMKQGDLRSVQAADVPPINGTHFEDAFDAVAPSVTTADLQRYIEWNGTFGSFRRMS